MLISAVGEYWLWQAEYINESGTTISRIYTEIFEVSDYNRTGWPSIISFLKPRIIAVDAFWNDVKPVFISLR